MKTLPRLIATICLVICIGGCGRLDSLGPVGPVPMVVDIPSLVGRSFDEVKQTLGPAAEGDGKLGLTWQFADGELTVMTVWKQEDQVEKFIFDPNLLSEAQKQNYKLLSYEQCGDMVGIDIRGLKPDSYDYDTGSEFANFGHLRLQGHDAYVGFEKRGGTCTGVTVIPTRRENAGR